VSGELGPSNRERRRAETKRDIVEAAWQLAREHGLAGVSMRDLGARVGMSAQSIYSYFAAKDDIYDAMFAQGNRAALTQLTPFAHRVDEAAADPVAVIEAVRATAHAFFDFCVSDATRYELMFQRTVRGFQPSPSSYALAEEFLDLMASRLRNLGVEPAGIDLWLAMLSGLTGQHLANDDGTRRWEGLLDEAVDMLLARLCPALHRRAAAQRKKNA
jgi:AcrR family transcriptional regulator